MSNRLHPTVWITVGLLLFALLEIVGPVWRVPLRPGGVYLQSFAEHGENIGPVFGLACAGAWGVGMPDPSPELRVAMWAWGIMAAAVFVARLLAKLAPVVVVF